jgi:hypothetical protein
VGCVRHARQFPGILSSHTGGVADGRPDTQFAFLLADLRLGLASAQVGAISSHPWLAARNRADAEASYDTVLRMKDDLDLTTEARGYLLQQLERLRLAIQSAYAAPPTAARKRVKDR